MGYGECSVNNHSFCPCPIKVINTSGKKEVIYKIICFEIIEVGISLYFEVDYITTKILSPILSLSLSLSPC